MLAVAHQLNAVAPSDYDWDWLKQGVRKVRAAGGRPAIALSADGTLGTMDLIDPALLIMGDVMDTDNEVLFLNNLSGFQTLVKTSWDALARGDHFPVSGGKTVLETECIRIEAGDPVLCALEPQKQRDYVRNVSIQPKLTLRVLNGIGSKVPLLAISTITGRGGGDHERMSEVGERKMTAEFRDVGRSVTTHLAHTGL